MRGEIPLAWACVFQMSTPTSPRCAAGAAAGQRLGIQLAEGHADSPARLRNRAEVAIRRPRSYVAQSTWSSDGRGHGVTLSSLPARRWALSRRRQGERVGARTCWRPSAAPRVGLGAPTSDAVGGLLGSPSWFARIALLHPLPPPRAWASSHNPISDHSPCASLEGLRFARSPSARLSISCEKRRTKPRRRGRSRGRVEHRAARRSRVGGGPCRSAWLVDAQRKAALASTNCSSAGRCPSVRHRARCRPAAVGDHCRALQRAGRPRRPLRLRWIRIAAASARAQFLQRSPPAGRMPPAAPDAGRDIRGTPLHRGGFPASGLRAPGGASAAPRAAPRRQFRTVRADSAGRPSGACLCIWRSMALDSDP